ncbi:hypothetical protein O3P69_002584 [Scylla paramamosain]|uniref:Uncharacterized protein n=1 Tax=Scylla paramamosain TaxID=85552 RepID=A0AAW0UNU0_SCYPA
MAGDSHEDPGGDTERDGKVVETHSRHASIGEESPSSSSSSSASSDAPARRFSLPAAMPAAPDSVAAPLPFEHSHRRLDTVVPVGMLAPQYHSGYRACPHRAHVLGGGPPCYLCSVLDAPPKYRKKEAKGWQKVKEKLALFSHGPPIPSQGGRPRDQEPPAAVFTISEWRPSNTTGVAPTEEVPASLSGSPDQRRAQERDNPAFDAQDSVEGGGECRATQVPSDSVAFGHSFAPHPPALITNTHLPPILLPQDNTEEERTTKCSRRCANSSIPSSWPQQVARSSSTTTSPSSSSSASSSSSHCSSSSPSSPSSSVSSAARWSETSANTSTAS